MMDLSNYRFEFRDYDCSIFCTDANPDKKELKEARKLANLWITKTHGLGFYPLYEIVGLIGELNNSEDNLVAIVVYADSGHAMPSPEARAKRSEEAVRVNKALKLSKVRFTTPPDKWEDSDYAEPSGVFAAMLPYLKKRNLSPGGI